MNDFWIGDLVEIVSSGRKGKYEGLINEKAKIKISNKIILVPIDDIRIIEEDDGTSFQPIYTDNVEVSNRFNSFMDILDLHIEKLKPEMKNEPPQLLLNYQIKIAKEFIKEAISRKRLSITIIHGKGTGVLKMEIYSLIQSFQEVYFTKSVNNDGAVEIHFLY